MLRNLGGRVASGFKINKHAIKKLTQEIEREFAKHPVRIPLSGDARMKQEAEASDVVGSEIELVAGWLIDWGYAYAKVKSGSIPSVDELMAEVGVTEFTSLVEPHVDMAVAALEQAGLLHDSARGFESRGMTLPVWLTEVGQREAAARIERRKDSRARRNACRDAVLRWTYERAAISGPAEVGAITQSPYGWFNGILFSATDLAESVRFLQDRGLLDGARKDLRLTQAGIECVEQYESVIEYLNRRDSAGVNVTIMGDNSGQLAVANRDVDQSQTSTNDADALAIFANALREFGKLVPEKQQPEYEEVAGALERESAKAEPNQGWRKALLDRARSLLDGAPADLHNLAQVAKVAFDILGQSAD